MADTATTATRTGAYGTADSSLARGFRAVLRIGAALLFIQHGAQKLLGWFGGMGDGATAELFSQMGLAGTIELVGGLLLLIGLFTRPVALIAAIEMVAAYFIAHMPQGGFPIENQGELALLYALVWAYIAAAGPGPLSVDEALAARRTTDTTGAPGTTTTRPDTTGGTTGGGTTGTTGTTGKGGTTGTGGTGGTTGGTTTT